jgi:adenylyl-sulfate kinase
MKPSSKNIVWQIGDVKPEERFAMLQQRPLTLWLTGLSAAGKSTLAFALERALLEAGHPCFVLDGDNVRHGLNQDLGFGAADRSENIRRIAEVAKLMNDAGLIVITAFISPFREDRLKARHIIGEGVFQEIYVDADLATCELRDPKGLYAKARRGEVAEFTGISSPYEPPLIPELIVHNSSGTQQVSLEKLYQFVQQKMNGAPSSHA